MENYQRVLAENVHVHFDDVNYQTIADFLSCFEFLTASGDADRNSAACNVRISSKISESKKCRLGTEARGVVAGHTVASGAVSGLWHFAHLLYFREQPVQQNIHDWCFIFLRRQLESNVHTCRGADRECCDVRGSKSHCLMTRDFLS